MSKHHILYGKCLFSEQYFEEASNQFITAETLVKEKTGDKSNERADLLYMIGVCLEKMGKELLSFDYFDKAIAVRPPREMHHINL